MNAVTEVNCRLTTQIFILKEEITPYAQKIELSSQPISLFKLILHLIFCNIHQIRTTSCSPATLTYVLLPNSASDKINEHQEYPHSKKMVEYLVSTKDKTKALA